MVAVRVAAVSRARARWAALSQVRLVRELIRAG